MKALRTAKLVIDLPVPGAEPFIRGVIQKIVVDENDNVLQVIPRQDEWYRRSSRIVADMVTFTDPVTSQQHTLSGAGLQVAITEMVSKWIIEDKAKEGITCSVNEHGRLIVEGE